MEALEILFKDNVLIKTKHDLSVEQNRIMQEIFFQVQIKKDSIVSIPRKRFLKILNNNNSKKITNIEKMLIELTNINISYRNPNGNWAEGKFVSWCEYRKEKDTYFVEVPKMLLNLLQNYKESGYTAVNIVKYACLKNNYAQRLYELIRMKDWTKESGEIIPKGVVEYPVNEIKEYLKLEDKYASFKNFRVRVIEPVVKELKVKELLDIYKVEYIKNGTRVASIKFYVNDYEPRKYSFNQKTKVFNPKNKKETEEVIEVPNGYNAEDINIRLLSYAIRISANTLKLKQEEYGEEAFIKAIKILEDRVQDEQQDKLKAPVRYLTGILDNLKNKENEEIAPQVSKAPPKKSNFANFTQREYDYDKLEKQLLGWDDGADEDYEK